MQFDKQNNIYNKILSNINTTDLINLLLKEYNQALIEDGYGITRHELLKLDKIDLRGILMYPDEKHNSFPDFNHMTFDRKLLAKNYWYCYVPCFASGVFQLNTARYLKFDVEQLNFTERSYIITVQDYARYETYWQAGVKTKTELKFPIIDEIFLTSPETMPNPWYYVQINILENYPFCDIYKRIPYEKLNWSKTRIDFWEKMILQYSERIENNIQNTKKYNSGENIIHVFLFAVILSNELLQQYKPKAERKKKNKANSNPKSETDTNKTKVPEKIIRNIGPIRMKSAKPPKPSTRETVIKYKTPVWKARGGVRHMKDGRVIPFKESIRKRKCLINADTNDTVPQTILQLRKERKTNGSNKTGHTGKHAENGNQTDQTS